MLSRYLVDIDEFNPETGYLDLVEYFDYFINLGELYQSPNSIYNHVCWGSLALQVI